VISDKNCSWNSDQLISGRILEDDLSAPLRHIFYGDPRVRLDIFLYSNWTTYTLHGPTISCVVILFHNATASECIIWRFNKVVGQLCSFLPRRTILKIWIIDAWTECIQQRLCVLADIVSKRRIIARCIVRPFAINRTLISVYNCMMDELLLQVPFCLSYG